MSIVHKISINSQYRASGNIYNANYILKQPINNVKHIIVNNIQMFHSETTINDINHNIYFQHTDSTYYQVSLEYGYYTVQELINEIIIKMNSIIGITDIYTNNEIDKTKCFYYISQNYKTKLITN